MDWARLQKYSYSSQDKVKFILEHLFNFHLSLSALADLRVGEKLQRALDSLFINCVWREAISLK
jgi:hypothetical protein